MQGILKAIVGSVSAFTLQAFKGQCSDPAATQAQVMSRIIQKNAGSAFGRDHGFDGITSMTDFRNRVPICTYEYLEPYIERSLNGDKGQLTVQQPVLFATTSGTTGTPKYIPVTLDSKKSKSKLMRVWMASVLRDHPGIFGGKILTVVSPEVESYSPGGIPCGAESGHGYRSMGVAVKSNYSAPYEVFEIKNYDAKYYALLRIASGQAISTMYTPNPSTVLLVAQRMVEYTEPIIRDVRDGKLSDEFEIEPEYRGLLQKGLAPNPGRAKMLETAANLGNGKLLPRHVWPELACICCWKGGTVGMYLDQFDQYFPPGIPVRDIGYYASEVRGSVVITDKGSDGVLSVTENLLEFYPADRDDTPQGEDLLLPQDLELGRQYFIYVTTNAGLYRYEMNDIIEVTDFYEQTPVIRFVQKGKGVVSFTGEKLYESQVIAAVDDALAHRRGAYEFIAAVGEMTADKPQYAFLIEFAAQISDKEGSQVLTQIDQALNKYNIEYDTKRASGRIEPPVLRIIKPGEFAAYRKREVAKGRNDGQFKTLRLTTDTIFGAEFAVERQIDNT